jgi:hypothetical protein
MNSDRLQPGDHGFAVTVSTEPGVVNGALLSQQFLFHRLEQAIPGLQTRLGIAPAFGSRHNRAHLGGKLHPVNPAFNIQFRPVRFRWLGEGRCSPRALTGRYFYRMNG